MSGGSIDAGRVFHPLRVAVLTVSDSRDRHTDSSGDLLAARIVAAGHMLHERSLVPHDEAAIGGQARRWLSDPAIDVIIANGGTGLSDRDVSPEVWRGLFEREFEGFTVLWHLVSYQTVGVSTMQSRACAGVAAGTVIYVLPGSNGACRDGWDKLISLQLDSRHRPCSVVDLIARFRKN
jgi:molybdenum cofactor biosynthesis protein B